MEYIKSVGFPPKSPRFYYHMINKISDTGQTKCLSLSISVKFDVFTIEIEI